MKTKILLTTLLMNATPSFSLQTINLPNGAVIRLGDTEVTCNAGGLTGTTVGNYCKPNNILHLANGKEMKHPNCEQAVSQLNYYGYFCEGGIDGGSVYNKNGLKNVLVPYFCNEENLESLNQTGMYCTNQHLSLTMNNGKWWNVSGVSFIDSKFKWGLRLVDYTCEPTIEEIQRKGAACSKIYADDYQYAFISRSYVKTDFKTIEECQKELNNFRN